MNIVNIPDPQNTGKRIVGYRFEQGGEVWGKYGLSEPLDWFEKRLNVGIKNHDGQKLVIQFVLDTDKEMSEYSRRILEELIK